MTALDRKSAAFGSQPVESLPFAVGGWRLTVGGWRFAVGGWQFGSGDCP
ncbi:MAG: hypothetical protein JO077_22990 [Verrucomicrobia bacterium]|nr:hypothetical protein [Verrucomicrobiota bacterium]